MCAFRQLCSSETGAASVCLCGPLGSESHQSSCETIRSSHGLLQSRQRLVLFTVEVLVSVPAASAKSAAVTRAQGSTKTLLHGLYLPMWGLRWWKANISNSPPPHADEGSGHSLVSAPQGTSWYRGVNNLCWLKSWTERGCRDQVVIFRVKLQSLLGSCGREAVCCPWLGLTEKVAAQPDVL